MPPPSFPHHLSLLYLPLGVLCSLVPPLLLAICSLYHKRVQQLNLTLNRCKMVLGTFYIDAFKQHGTQQLSVVSIYMSIAGASREECMAAKSRYLITLMPKVMDIFEAISIVIIEPMRLLERGIEVCCLSCLGVLVFGLCC